MLTWICIFHACFFPPCGSTNRSLSMTSQPRNDAACRTPLAHSAYDLLRAPNATSPFIAYRDRNSQRYPRQALWLLLERGMVIGWLIVHNCVKSIPGRNDNRLHQSEVMVIEVEKGGVLAPGWRTGSAPSWGIQVCKLGIGLWWWRRIYWAIDNPVFTVGQKLWVGTEIMSQIEISFRDEPDEVDQAPG